MDERRRHMRFEANLNGEFTVLNSDQRGLLTTNNFSRGGFKAVLNKRVDEGAILNCEMRFPETIMPFFSSGKVVWIREQEKNAGSKFDAGIQLEQMDPTERQFLVEYFYSKWNKSNAALNKTEFDIEA